MIRKDIQEMVWSGLSEVDLSRVVVDRLLLNVITTYDTKYEQQIWDMYVQVIKNEFRTKIDPYYLPPTMKIVEKGVFGGLYSPEKHILGQVISDISPLNRLPQLCKISLFYKNIWIKKAALRPEVINFFLGGLWVVGLGKLFLFRHEFIIAES